MKINCIVFGLSGIDTAPIVRKMKNHPNFGKVIWFGIVDDVDINSYQAYKFASDYDYSIKLPDDYLRHMRLVLGDFLISSARRNEVQYGGKTYTLGFGSTYEYLHHFMRYCYLVYDLITKNKINLLIIDGIPHTSIDVLLNQAAKYFNVKTLFLYQPNIPNKFMYFTELKEKSIDFSIYYSEENRPIKKLEQTYRVKDPELPFYMGDFSHLFYDESKILKDISISNVRLPYIFRKIEQYVILPILKLMKADLKIGLLFALRFFKSAKDPQALTCLTSVLLKHLKYRAYSYNINKYSKKEVDLNATYVYFPLSFQPELTTECLGGSYTDILSAIEKIRALIPKEWKIYIKDHVIQYEFARDQIFFDRLSSIPNAILVDRFYSSFDLIKNSQFVATVNGTVGWEAIHMGKKACNFGSIYYHGLPGIFNYSNELKLNDIMGASFTREEVEEAINKLISRMETGIVNADFSAMIKDFDPEKNAQDITEFISDFFFNKGSQSNNKQKMKALAS